MLKREKFNYFYSFILIPILILIMSYITMAIFGNFKLEVISIKTFIFNFIMFSLFHLFLSFEYRNTRRSLITISILIYILCFINQVKISYMNEPLYISDFNYFQNYNNISVFTGNSLIGYIFFLLIKSIPIILFIIFICFISYKFNVVVEKKHSYIYGLLFLLSLFLLLCPFNFSKKLYYKYIYTDRTHNVGEFVSYKDLYVYYGIFSGIYYQYLNSLIDYSVPDDYDEKYLNEMEDNHLEKSIVLGRPNIVVILSESFFDINKINDNIKFNIDLLEDYNYIKSQGDYVNIISPSFGGETANVLFEMLVGGNISYFNSGFIPFVDLYRDSRSRDSLVNVLKNNGYYTSLISGEDSYDLDKTMNKIGFDDYIVTHNKKIKGNYTSDSYMADLIIDKLDNSENNSFIVVETMQNHMPYYYEKYSTYDIDILNTSLNDEESLILKSYGQGVYDASLMLKKIYNYVSNSSNDTIVVFFGDHLPPLKNKKLEDIYSKLDYFNTNDKLINTYRKYNMEALIFSNYDNDLVYPEYLGFDLLLNYLINNMDLDIPKYYKWLYSNSSYLPTYNRYVAINSNGSLCYTSDLRGEDKKFLELRNLMFYKNFIKN